jgi:hypothetical protein
LVAKLTQLQNPSEGRGDSFCRACSGENLFTAIDLGNLPLANELPLIKDYEVETFPLHLRICSDCKLGQVADVVTPERIFRDYRYLSSMSSTFLKHASDFVTEMVQEGTFRSEDWVLEIASNDGYLLRNFLHFGIRAIGVEPAENVAKISRKLGIETIAQFFSSELAKEILAQNGYPRLIIANNVMAHVPDLGDFVKGLSILCGPDTKISIENPSLLNILEGMQFDTIYHEHYSYLSTTSVANISRLNGLCLVKVENVSVHGGSNRYWLASADSMELIDSSVDLASRHESESELFSPEKWTSYAAKVSLVLKDFTRWICADEKSIYGYGAAAKASTILNSINFKAGSILGIADVSLEKQKRFMPPHAIKIISPDELFAANPTDIIIFPWNIKLEIANYLRKRLGNNVRLWCAIPSMHEIEIP